MWFIRIAYRRWEKLLLFFNGLHWIFKNWCHTHNARCVIRTHSNWIYHNGQPQYHIHKKPQNRKKKWQGQQREAGQEQKLSHETVFWPNLQNAANVIGYRKRLNTPLYVEAIPYTPSNVRMVHPSEVASTWPGIPPFVPVIFIVCVLVVTFQQSKKTSADFLCFSIAVQFRYCSNTLALKNENLILSLVILSLSGMRQKKKLPFLPKSTLAPLRCRSKSLLNPQQVTEVWRRFLSVAVIHRTPSRIFHHTLAWHLHETLAFAMSFHRERVMLCVACFDFLFSGSLHKRGCRVKAEPGRWT